MLFFLVYCVCELQYATPHLPVVLPLSVCTHGDAKFSVHSIISSLVCWLVIEKYLWLGQHFLCACSHVVVGPHSECDGRTDTPGSCDLLAYPVMHCSSVRVHWWTSYVVCSEFVSSLVVVGLCIFNDTARGGRV